MEEYDSSVGKLFDGMAKLPTQKVKRTLAITNSADSIVRVTMAKQIMCRKDYNYGDVLSWLAELGFLYLTGNMGAEITREQQLLLAGD